MASQAFPARGARLGRPVAPGLVPALPGQRLRGSERPDDGAMDATVRAVVLALPGGEIACATIGIVDQPGQLGTARDERDAVRPYPQLAGLGVGEGEEGVAAGHDADVDLGDPPEPAQRARAFELTQQPDRGGVQKVLRPLLVFVQQRWRRRHIQVGAAPTLAGARSLIERAKSKMGPGAAGLQALTQEVDVNGSTIFRARFAGFSGKEQARQTCTRLKSKSIACLAVPN